MRVVLGLTTNKGPAEAHCVRFILEKEAFHKLVTLGNFEPFLFFMKTELGVFEVELRHVNQKATDLECLEFVLLLNGPFLVAHADEH